MYQSTMEPTMKEHLLVDKIDTEALHGVRSLGSLAKTKLEATPDFTTHGSNSMSNNKSLTSYRLTADRSLGVPPIA